MIQKIGLAITTSLLSWNISFAQTIDSYIPSQKNIEARKNFKTTNSESSYTGAFTACWHKENGT